MYSSDFFFFRLTGKQRECINLGSFNYLGLVEVLQAEEIVNAITNNGIITCSPASEIGTGK